MAKLRDIALQIESCEDPSLVQDLVSAALSIHEANMNDEDADVLGESGDLILQVVSAVVAFFQKEPFCFEYYDIVGYTLPLCLDRRDVRVGGRENVVIDYKRWLICYFILWRKYEKAKVEWRNIIGTFKQSESSIIQLVLEVTGYIVDWETEDEEAYRFLLTMVEEIRRFSDTVDMHLRTKLVSVLCSCTKFLAGKSLSFDENENVIEKICVISFLEYAKISNDEMFEEIVCKLCTSLFAMTKMKFKFASNVMTSVAKDKEVEHPESEDTETIDGDGVLTLQYQMGELKQQIKSLKEKKVLTPMMCVYIEKNISNILFEVVYREQVSLKESIDLIEEARKLREKENLYKRIDRLDRAIYKLTKQMKKDDEASSPVGYILAEAFCLRALCKHERNPHSEEFEDDLKEALDMWLDPQVSKFSTKTKLVSEKTLYLLYHALDLLLLRVRDDRCFQKLYDMLIICWKWRGDGLEGCLARLWQSRSIAHTMCTSPVHHCLVATISKNTEHQDSTEIWSSCMGSSKSLEIDYEQRFSVTPTFSLQPNSQNRNEQTVNKMKQAARDLILHVPMSTKAEFLAAHIFYDLGEIMLSNGSILEALVYAKEASRLRYNLYQRYFVYSVNKSTNLPSLSMHHVVATEAWSSEVKIFILTPYNVLRCYLESRLQEGTIEEILGNGETAERLLLEGKRLSSLEGLSIFTFSFSVALGKFYRKKKLWHLAEEELKSLKHSCCKISCSKCKVIMEVTVEQGLGDYLRSSFNHKVTYDLEKAISCFVDAVEKLKGSEWDNNVSKPVKESKTLLCDASFTAGKEVTESTSDLDEIHCWHCLPVGIMKAKSLRNVTEMKWEFTRRRYLLRLLMGLGKCFVVNGETDKANEVFLESISALVCRSTFHPQDPAISFSYLNKLVENNVVADIFVIEHASLLYIISWFSLQSCYEDGKRKKSCDKFSVVPGLKLAFVVCSEVPDLFQNVSRLLSIMYTLSFENSEFSIKSSSSDPLSVSKWGSYFHQLTLGTHLNYQLPSLVKQEGNTENVSGWPGSRYISSRRLAPKSVVELEGFVCKFFQDLPQATILGLSIFKDGYGSLLQKLLPDSSFIRSWLMFSRFSSNCAPVVIVLPVDSILQRQGEVPDIFKSLGQEWKPPWGITIVDEIAPGFGKIVKERTRLKMRDMTQNVTTRGLYHHGSETLNGLIRNLLRDMEELWFGPWKHLLLGEQLEGIEYEKIGCYIGERQPGSPWDRLHELLSKIGKKDPEPVILVLDNDIQMLPWESMDVFKNQELYRMPSVASIMYLYDKCCGIQKQDGNDSAVFPMIDPLDAFYVVNPSGDLTNIEPDMDNWFEDHELQGICDAEPKEDELARELLKRDLFIYMGHDDGLQYIPGRQIAALEKCAAAILMGCSSGVLYLNGSYSPYGAPLCYLLAGSPIVIANLWDLTDFPMCDFTHGLLEEFVKARADCETSTVRKRKIGSFMRAGRDSCGEDYRYLMGAAAVCYGIPTGIRKKKREC